MNLWLLTVALLVLLHQSAAQRQLGIIGDASGAGFFSVYEHPQWSDPKERYSLLLSTFSPIPFTVDASYIFYHIGKELGDIAGIRARALYDEFTWPREPSQTPVDVFGFETITQPDGFLVPGKNTGSIYIVDMRQFPVSNPTTYNIAEDFNSPDYIDFFYHRVVWKDMDGDGKKDALVCRARRELFVGDTTELVWYKQPANPFSTLWEKTFINSDCDTFSVMETLTVGGQDTDALFSVGYFTNKLVVHWSDAADGSWANPSDIKNRNIDTGGQFFDLEMVDLNMDGKKDLLVSINAEEDGSVVAYEVPEDFKTGRYIAHTLASGFDSRSGLFGGGSPGTASAFYPSDEAENAGRKPWILLSGDDDGRCYVMVPRSEAADSWDYEMLTLVDEGPGQIIGKPVAADVDGDGYKEIFIPSFVNERIFIFTYAP